MSQINYICPNCKSYLLVDNRIVLSYNSTISGHKGIILIHAELGNFKFNVHPLILFHKNEVVDFYCPVCHKNLKADETNTALARILLQDKNDTYDIFFSRKAGEHSTFKVHNDIILEKFGEDTSKYIGYKPNKLKKQTEDIANHYF